MFTPNISNDLLTVSNIAVKKSGFKFLLKEQVIFKPDTVVHNRNHILT